MLAASSCSLLFKRRAAVSPGRSRSHTEVLARWTASLWEPRLQRREKPVPVFYVDGRKPVYADSLIPRGLIGRTGKILGCRALVVLHDQEGHPLLATTHRGDQHLTIGLPAILRHYEQASDLESLKRIVVDREGMSAGFLAVLASEGRTVVTVLQTDHLSAAVKTAGKTQAKESTVRYEALMAHYGMQPTKNNVTIAYENGDVEQSHHRFKQAVDQALRVRASRDFPNRDAYERFLADLIRSRNLKRQVPFIEEQAALQPLPTTPLAPCQEVWVIVSQFSTIHIKTNVYSVPSRLIGTTVLVRLRAETLEGYVGSSIVFTLPRLVGKQQHRVDYRHIIWSLVRKPGAFVAYRYRDDLFPTTIFRLVYDRLVGSSVERVDREYVRILHLAASTSESEVETAISLLLETPTLPTFDTVRDLVHPPASTQVLTLATPDLDLSRTII